MGGARRRRATATRCASCRSGRRTPRSGRRRRWRCSSDEDRPPGSVPGRADRRLAAPARARSRRSTSCRPRSSPRTSAAASWPTTRTTRRATEDAFAVLHEIAARRLRRGRLTVVDATNVQREAREPLMQIAREHDLFAVAIVLDLPGRAVPRAQPRRGPTATSASTSSAASARSSSARCGTCSARASGASFVLKSDGGGRGASSSRARRCGPTGGPSTGRSTSSATSTAATTSWSRCSAQLGYVATAVHPDGRRAVFVGDFVDRGPDVARRAAARDGDGGGRHAICVPGNHDVKLARKLDGRDVQITHGLAESLEQLGARAAGVPRRGRASSCDGLVCTPCSTTGGSCVAHAGHDGALPGPRLRPRARVRAVRRDDGRDRRVRAAGPRRLGGRLPRPGDRRLRPHAGAGAGVAQQHDQHRHRLRVRRRADRAALAGARARVRAGGARVLRAGAAVPRRRRRPRRSARATCSTSTTSPASGSSRRGSARHGHDPRGERGGARSR